MAVVSCTKKNNVIEKPESTGDFVNMQRVSQSFIDISTNESLNIIKLFKESRNNVKGRLIDQDSISIDSSLFLVETVLNYDFDFPFDKNYSSTSIDFTYNLNTSGNNLNVSSDDFQTLFESISDSLNANVNDSIKLMYIDAECFIYIPSQNVATYKFEAKLININRFVTCDDTPFNNCVNYGPVQATTYYNWFGVNTGLCDPFPEMNNHINCEAIEASTPCTNGKRLFFNNISALIFSPGCLGFSSNPFPGSLYASNYATLSSLQTNPLSFSASYGDNLFYGCKLLAHNNIPAGKVFLNATISPPLSPCVNNSNPTTYSVEWRLTANYAKRNCITLNY